MFKPLGVIRTHAKTWSKKRSIPEHLRSGAMRADFGIHGYLWIVQDHAGRILMRDDSYVEVHKCYLRTGGAIIGNHDASIADGFTWGDEWRQSLRAATVERISRMDERQ